MKMWKRVLFGCFVVVLSFFMTISISAYGDSLYSATYIYMDSEYTGTISSSNTSDNFTFTLSQSGALNISAKAYMACVNLAIYDSDGNRVWSVSPYWNSTTQQSNTDTTIYLTSGKYYFSVSKNGSYYGKYSFELSFVSSAESFSESNNGNNNTITTADTISFSKTYKGMIALNDSADFYEVELSSTGALKIESTIKMEHAHCTLYDTDGNKLWSVSPYWNSTTKQSSNSNTLYLNKGIYYISFSKNNGSTGNYNFKLTFTSSGESFSESINGNNNTIEVANPIAFSKLYNGAITLIDSADFYEIELSSTGALKIESTIKMEHAHCTLYDTDGNKLWSVSPYWNSTTKQSSNSNTLYLNKGIYYISFSKNNGSTGNYSFKLTFASSQESFNETVVENNNTFDMADAISLNKNYRGALCQNDNVDMYYFTLSSDSNISIAFEAKDMQYVYVKIYDENGNQKASYNPYWDSSTKVITLSKSLSLEKGSYYLSISKNGYNGNYSFIIGDGRPAKTTNLKASSQTTNSVTLTWNKVAGATGYRIYKYDPNTGGYPTVGYIPEKTSFTVSNLNIGTKYKFKVRAYVNTDNGPVWGEYSDILTTSTKPAKTTGLKVSSKTNSSITLTWNKVAGATGYRIYKYDPSTGKYPTVGYIPEKTSFTVSNLSVGAEHKFKVRAYINTDQGAVWGAYSDVLTTSTKIAKPYSVKIEQSTSSIKLTWSKCTGADGYGVYLKTSSGWSLLGTTSKLTGTIKNLKVGTTYTFAVQPYVNIDGVKAWGDYISLTVSTLPATPTAKVSSTSKGKVTVSWNVVTGGQKYQLYYKVGNGSYKLYKTYNGGQNLTFKNLKSGSKYTFAVRAYRTVNEKVYYSSYKPVTVTIK